MASKDVHPGGEKAAIGQQAAGLKRGAPGKRFIGDTAQQSANARRATRKKVGRMAEVEAAQRRVEELGEPVSAVLAELIADTVKLLQTLVSAPFRIAAAVRRR